ncbi:hypothetical protein [Microbacterium aquilitoris]|uniref:hypothetical protein n=1 Tax=Microbacterium aquilitoris TaxID=3067307 RepID=UPI00288E0A44|nr:hypothetical protein [Microbacterium sp. KSW2-22]MDT3344901.1 hypothetical protein [Microbacterium sp. KSW2-22]
MTAGTAASRPTGVAAVLAVAVIQVLAIVVTAVLWFFHTVFAGGACGASCDGAAADAAGMLFVAAVAASILVTVSAAVVARRTGRDLAWVPLVSTALVVAGYLAAVAVFDAAMR